MCYKFSIKVGLRYFFAKKNEKFVSFIAKFSLIGVALGVAALIVVMSVMNGFRAELAKNIIGLNSDINITSIQGAFDSPQEIVEILKNQNFVQKVVMTSTGQALAIGPRNSSGILIKGMNIGDLSEKKQIINNILSGKVIDFADKHNVIIGFELAKNLGVNVGDNIKIISSQFISTAFGSIPRTKDFKVSAIFASGLYDFDSAIVLMNTESAMRLLSQDNINMIEVYSINSDLSESYAENIENLFSEKAIIVTNWQKQYAQFFNALKVERVAMFTILSLIIIVAAFNIISSLFMLVKDKTHDIAILRTMGATRNDIILIFIINGMMIGALGTICGVILGYGFASNIENIRKFLEKMTGIELFNYALYFLMHLPSKIELSNVILVTLITLSLCLLATIYPAYRASKIDPVEAMRYE